MSEPPAAPDLRVGNDVVDLEAPRMRGKSADERFIDRIFAPSERDQLANALDPDLELWSMWAAKEAAYKVVSKLEDAPPPFVHTRFVVGFVSRVPEPGAPVHRTGAVRYGERTIPVAVDHLPVVVRACAAWDRTADLPCLPPESSPAFRHTIESLNEPHALWTLPGDQLLAMLTERERRPVHSRPSAAVRVAAKADLAGALGIEERRIEIVCGEGPKGRMPPFVLIDGETCDVDVSLSHHGEWIAWAIWTGEVRETTLTA